MLVGRVRQCFSAVFDGLTCLAGERPVVDDEQARVAETLKKLHRGDMDIVAYEDEHKFDGDGGRAGVASVRLNSHIHVYMRI